MGIVYLKLIMVNLTYPKSCVQSLFGQYFYTDNEELTLSEWSAVMFVLSSTVRSWKTFKKFPVGYL